MSNDNKTVLIDYDLHLEMKYETLLQQKQGIKTSLKKVIEEACRLYLEGKKYERKANIGTDGNLQ